MMRTKAVFNINEQNRFGWIPGFMFRKKREEERHRTE